MLQYCVNVTTPIYTAKEKKPINFFKQKEEARPKSPQHLY